MSGKKLLCKQSVEFYSMYKLLHSYHWGQEARILSPLSWKNCTGCPSECWFLTCKDLKWQGMGFPTLPWWTLDSWGLVPGGRVDSGEDMTSLPGDALGYLLQSLRSLPQRSRETPRVSLCWGHFFFCSSVPWEREIGGGDWQIPALGR